MTGVGRRKNELVLRMLAEGGVHAFPGSVALVRALRAAGRGLAVVSASENSAAVLDAAGIADLFDLRVDGHVTSEHGLAGKPAPDTYLYAARQLMASNRAVPRWWKTLRPGWSRGAPGTSASSSG